MLSATAPRDAAREPIGEFSGNARARKNGARLLLPDGVHSFSEVCVGDEKDRDRSDDTTDSQRDEAEHDKTPHTPNPPRTTKHGITAPKFGSAGSGGAEFESGLDKN